MGTHASNWRRPLLIAAMVAATTLAGCKRPVPPVTCPEGMVLAADGKTCEPGPALEPQCPPGEFSARADGGCAKAGWSDCPAGFVLEADGGTCEPVLPATACAPGTMPVLGSVTCAAVGPGVCAAGFELDPSGWGCRDVSPEAACSGAFIEVLGKKDCVPLGDCAAAFPPADATVFVDPTFTPAQLDGAHFNTLGDAVDAAPDGAVVAIAAGTYAEAVMPKRPVRLVGRCAAQVTLDGAGRGSPGVLALGVLGVTVEQVTMTGYSTAIFAAMGGGVTVRHSLIEASHDVAVGALSAEVVLEDTVVRGTVRASNNPLAVSVTSGGRVTLRRSALVGNQEVGLYVHGEGSSALVEASIIRDTLHPDGAVQAMGLAAWSGAKVQVTGSLLANNAQLGAGAYGASPELVITDSVVRDSTRLASDIMGYGVFAKAGAVRLERATVTGHDGPGVSASSADASLTVVDSVIAKILLNPDQNMGPGLLVEEGAQATVSGTAIVEASREAVYANGAFTKVVMSRSLLQDTRPDAAGVAMGASVFVGATLEAAEVAVVRTQVNGITSIGPNTQVELDRVLVLDTDGVGLNVQKGGSAKVDRAVFARSQLEGLFVEEPGTRVELTRSVVSDTRDGPDGDPGIGVVAHGDTELVVRDCAIVRSGGFGVLLDGTGVGRVKARFSTSVVADTRAFWKQGAGAGVQAQGLADLTLTNVQVRANARVGVSFGLNAQGRVVDSWVSGSRATQEGFGHGVFFWDGASATLTGVLSESNEGIGVVAAASAFTLDGSRVTRNAVGIHVQQGTVLEVDDQVPVLPLELTASVSTDSQFGGNATRIGAGEVPLPALGHVPLP